MKIKGIPFIGEIGDLSTFEIQLLQRLVGVIMARRNRLEQDPLSFVQVKQTNVCLSIYIDTIDEIERTWIELAENLSCKNWE